MGKKNRKSNLQKSICVQTARNSSHPFTVIDRYRPLSKPEFAVYDAIREAVPIVSAAIEKIIRLVGNFEIKCDNKYLEKGLCEFLTYVPTGYCTVGINSFIDSYLNSLIMYGTAVGEIVMSDDGNFQGIYSAPLNNVEIKQSNNPFKCSIGVKDEKGKFKEVRYPARILLSAANPTADHPEGHSLLEGLPFVTSVLLKIFNSIGSNFERMGNLRYAVTYKPQFDSEMSFGEDRAKEIANQWSEAMNSRDEIRDFVAVGDVDIKVIGADNQIIDSEIPVRQMLEQIIAKTGLPPFLLGISWSDTECMSAHQSDVLTSELKYYRSILNPAIERICKYWMISQGKFSNFEIIWNDITLQDELDDAKAQLLRAQALKLEQSEV